jgi:hypothetical protein
MIAGGITSGPGGYQSANSQGGSAGGAGFLKLNIFTHVQSQKGARVMLRGWRIIVLSGGNNGGGGQGGGQQGGSSNVSPPNRK